jgi:hypothetical protein
MSQYWISTFLSTFSPPVTIYYLLPYPIRHLLILLLVLRPIGTNAHADYLCTGFTWINHICLPLFLFIWRFLMIAFLAFE